MDHRSDVAHGGAGADPTRRGAGADPTRGRRDGLPARGRAAAVRAAGLARAVVVSYGPVWRWRRMAAFYGAFLGPGDLAFDVGSHAGNRVRAFRRLGARVVAVEPQPDLLAVLRLLYGRDPRVRVEACALGAAPGRARLHLAPRTPTVATLSASWIREVRADRRFATIRWDREVEVPVHTLDELIARYGEPRFCKVDAEGSEPAVLAGLSRPLPALSVEYLPAAVDRAVRCVERLAALGEYRFARSPLETLRWASPGWVDGAAIVAALRELPASAPPGDLYALRADQACPPR